MRSCILIPILAILGTGCAWQVAATKSLAGLHESLKGASVVGEGHYGARCTKLAEACTAKPCKPAVDCLTEFKRFNKVVLGARVAIHLGQGTVAMGDEKSTMMLLLKASTLFVEVKNILLKAGVMP